MDVPYYMHDALRTPREFSDDSKTPAASARARHNTNPTHHTVKKNTDKTDRPTRTI